MGSLSNENTQQTSQSASLAPLSQPPPTLPSPAAASCSSNNSTSALSHPSTQSTLNTTSTPSVKTEKPVTWQKKRSKTINAAMFQGMLAKSSREGAVDGKEPFDTAEAMKNIADRKVEKFRPFNASWERLPGEQAEAEAAVGGWASISVEDAILNHMRVRDMATSQRKKYRRGKWTYAFERCLEAQKKADARMAKLQLEEDGGGDANVSCIFGTGIFGAVKIDVNNPEVFVPYNIAIAEYLREVAAAMTAKITVAEVMDRMRKGARGMNSTLKQEATCQKFRAEAYGRLATVVESFPVAVTADVLVNNQKKDDSSISSSSVTIVRSTIKSLKRKLPTASSRPPLAPHSQTENSQSKSQNSNSSSQTCLKSVHSFPSIPSTTTLSPPSTLASPKKPTRRRKKKKKVRRRSEDEAPLAARSCF